jgi:formylglycine-generating enzyme required for sulfatase activity
VGSFLPNAFGLHDMHGNVLEWCNDVYVRERHAPTRSAGTSPTDTRVSRGGSWWHVANNYARSSYRHASNASFSEKYQGVRAARDLR